MNRTMADLKPGDIGIVLGILDVSPETEARLSEQGFVPGVQVQAIRNAPGGDPRIFHVDGSDVALRIQTASRILLLHS